MMSMWFTARMRSPTRNWPQRSAGLPSIMRPVIIITKYVNKLINFCTGTWKRLSNTMMHQRAKREQKQECMTLKMKALGYFKVMGTTCLTTRHCTPVSLTSSAIPLWNAHIPHKNSADSQQSASNGMCTNTCSYNRKHTAISASCYTHLSHLSTLPIL